MKIVYRPHLVRRLKERKFPKDYPQKIIKEAEEEFYDTVTKHHIAIKKLRYAGKLKSIVVAYDIIGNNKEIVTIFPISSSELKNKIHAGRWKAYEKN